MGIFIVEVGAWLTMLSAAALSFGVAGAHGVTALLDPSAMSGIHAITGEGGFAARPAVLLYAAVIAAGVAGMFAPREKLTGRAALRVALIASAAIAGLAITQMFLVSALFGVLVGLGVGAALAAVLSLVSGTRVKPWRSAGVAASVMLFASYTAQLIGGTAGGHEALRWLLLVGGLVMLTGVIVLLVQKSERGVSLPVTGAQVLDRTTARPGTPVSSAWPCHLLFGVLGAVGVLAQPTVADLGFGQAGMSVILCAVLLGWAVGFETGPDFAPGMTRTRLTSFSLIAAGVLTVAAGVLAELSGKAVLSGGVAFLVGLGVRSQRYRFSRRIGTVVGMAAAILLTAIGFTAEIPLSSVASWDILPADLAYVLIGVVAVGGGIVSLFTFGPTGIHGIGVDVIHAFRVPASSGRPRTEAAATAAAPDAAQADDAAERDSSAPGAQSLSTALPAAPGDGPVTGTAGRRGSGGLFIAVEGGDGTGKTTQIHLLADALRDQGFDEVVTTREPGGTEAGTLLRSVVLDGDGVTPRAEALVFAADRSHHVATLVRPIVDRGGIVLTDRYIDSSRAYQAAGRDLGDDDVVALSTWATEGLRPDLTIVLDANPAVTRQRTTSRGEENHLDSLDHTFHTTVRESFLAYAAAAPDRYVVIDAGRDIDTVAGEVLRAVQARLDDGPASPGTSDSASGAQGIADDGAQGVVDSGARHAVVDEPVTEVRPAAHSAAPVDEDPVTEVRPAPATPPPPAEDSEAPTTVQPAVPAAEPAAQPHPQPQPQPHPHPVEEPATRPVSSPSRQSSRERLRAQAEIERQARERLRAQHGHDRRGPDGPGPR